MPKVVFVRRYVLKILVADNNSQLLIADMVVICITQVFHLQARQREQVD